ncbi:hypothetical protein GGI17_006641, partial [Coemansia sp. S146]
IAITSKDFISKFKAIGEILKKKYDISIKPFEETFWPRINEYSSFKDFEKKTTYYDYDLEDKRFDAFIELRVNSVYIDKNTNTSYLNLNVSDAYVFNVENKDRYNINTASPAK